jgi:hypothetical protein
VCLTLAACQVRRASRAYQAFPVFPACRVRPVCQGHQVRPGFRGRRASPTQVACRVCRASYPYRESCPSFREIRAWWSRACPIGLPFRRNLPRVQDRRRRRRRQPELRQSWQPRGSMQGLQVRESSSYQSDPV